MVEVPGSNPGGPTKQKTLANGGGFLFVGMPDEIDDCSSTNTTLGAFGPPKVPVAANSHKF